MLEQATTISKADERPARASSDGRRLPYSTLGIALGFAGAGSAWRLAVVQFAAPAAVSEVLFAIGALWWLIVLIAHVPVTPRRVRRVVDDIHHPITGPFPAYVPVVGLLLTGHYAPYLPTAAGAALCVIWVAVLTVMCAQMLAFWLSGALHLEQIHPGYALPVIAGPFIAAMTLTGVGFPEAGIAAAAVGGFYWLTLGTVIFLRLIHSAPLPAPLTPTLSVLVTPPATAGLAWFALQNGRIDTVQIGLAGVVVLFLATQLFMIPQYLVGPFHLGYWALSFPAGALASYSLRWAISQPSLLTAVIAGIALCLGTALLLVLCAGTAVMLRRDRPTATPNASRA